MVIETESTKKQSKLQNAKHETTVTDLFNWFYT
jgi:hypothetical protein